MINKLEIIKTKLKEIHIWDAMENTFENSPWHRESSVALHTEMAIEVYIKEYMPHRSKHEYKYVLLALLFHDTGKPDARQEHHSEERGTYYRFTGHEKLSARIFENFCVQNHKWLFPLFNINLMDIHIITWMIEHHLPFGIKKSQKIKSLVQTLVSLFRYDNIFFDMIISDCKGRISDNHEIKIQDTEDWIQMMAEKIQDEDTESLLNKRIGFSQKNLYMPIGASGSGKSTWTREMELNHNNIFLYSWDTLRVELYKSAALPEDFMYKLDISIYKNAFEYCNENKSLFNKYKNDVFMDALKRGEDIIVDNTNLSKKSRTFFIQEAKKHGYKITGITFPIDEDTLLNRAITRTDKKIPVQSVHNMYQTLSQPSLGGEFDDIQVNVSNIN